MTFSCTSDHVLVNVFSVSLWAYAVVTFLSYSFPDLSHRITCIWTHLNISLAFFKINNVSKYAQTSLRRKEAFLNLIKEPAVKKVCIQIWYTLRNYISLKDCREAVIKSPRGTALIICQIERIFCQTSPTLYSARDYNEDVERKIRYTHSSLLFF